MSYFNYQDYKEMVDDSTYYFSGKKVVNFDIIYHECRRDTLEGTYRNYKTVKSAAFKNFLENDKKKLLVEFLEKLKGTIYG